MRLGGVALVYLLVAGVAVYGVAERSDLSGRPVSLPASLGVAAAIHLALGVLAARWWAVALPALALLLSVPAGYPDVTAGEPLPIWFAFLLMLPVATPAVAAGILATKMHPARRRLRSS